MSRLFLFVFCFIVSCRCILLAQTDDDIKLTPRGYGAFEIGQIGHGLFPDKTPNRFDVTIAHIWQQRCFGNLGFTAQYKDFMTIDIAGEGLMAFSTPQIGNEQNTTQSRNFYYIKSSNVLFTVGSPENLAGSLQIGYFPYKYNPDVRNLGEYLLRSIPYPLNIVSEFDFAQVTLLGVKFHMDYANKMINNDLILHTETVTHPVQNWSITDIADYTYADVLTIGGGISFYHLLSAYQGANIPNSLDEKLYPKNLPEDKRSELDTSVDYNAVKFMTRFSVDPKKFIPVDFFGKNDLRFYGEFDLLGLKNYEPFHKNIKDRMMWTFGFNLPGFNIVDIINMEFEYCENGSAFSDALYFSKTPSFKPSTLGFNPDGTSIIRAKWRWSVYLKETFFNDHFSVIAQVARDHKKINFYYFDLNYMSLQEALPRSSDWWWAFKTEFKF